MSELISKLVSKYGPGFVKTVKIIIKTQNRQNRDRHNRDRHNRDRHNRDRHNRDRHNQDRQMVGGLLAYIITYSSMSKPGPS